MARRILLADDSVTAQNMGRRILHDAGYEIITVNNGSAALKKVAEQKPDLIILDVYMPGYGGLEVCSRLKENRETQRIPVLLTVGKLEPFKPEEARRVKADAYIVKPFEASELLSALTKLEDKIVPGPEPYKPGRFAKALASVEQSESEKDFGDKETGWKERLVIPGKKSKKGQPEPEPEAVPAKSPHVVERGEDFHPSEPKAGFERPIPGGLPQDISAEEIAAIAAAAAKISGKSTDAPLAVAPQEETPAEPKSAAPESPKTEEAVATPPAAAASTATPEPAREEAPATFASSPETQEMATEPEKVVEAAAQAGERIQEAEPKTISEVPAEPEKHAASDAEVLAALASLTPANGDLSASTAAEAATSAINGAGPRGPRWVAEAVALTEEESTFLLQSEMEKAYAAFAAGEAGRMLLSQPVEASAPSNVNGDVSSQPSVPEATQNAELQPIPEEAFAETVQATAGIVTERVATSTEQLTAEAALAAAASAGATESSIHETQPVASTSSSTPMEEGSGMGETELAAAWANWRNIRESIVGTQPNATPESVPEEKPAEAVAPPASEESNAEESKAETSQTAEAPDAPAAADPAELSSIVDNMLAELKPKLMEELKRKLGK